jgi:transposase
MDEILPLIPYGASKISNNLSVVFENDEWTYYHGALPVATHAAEDKRFFRMITSSFIINGACRNCDIIRVFNVSKSSVIRNCEKYAAHGSDAFFRSNGKGERKSKVLTDDKLTKAEELLSAGFSRSEVASKIGVKYDTLNKAIQDGPLKSNHPLRPCQASTSRREVLLIAMLAKASEWPVLVHVRGPWPRSVC